MAYGDMGREDGQKYWKIWETSFMDGRIIRITSNLKAFPEPSGSYLLTLMQYVGLHYH